MPFTFSHPAIVLPFKFLPKRWVSMTGLIVGSMLPDFEYFIRMKVESIYSHTWAGLFWFDLPIGLLMVFIYQTFIKDQLIDNLPPFFSWRFLPFKTLSIQVHLQQIFVLVYCILIGAATHLVWDGFTHSTGYFVGLFPMLTDKILIARHSLPVYNIIQHGSTILGMTTLIISICTLPISLQNKGRKTPGFWLQIILVLIIVVVVRLTTGLSFHRYGDLVVTVISGGFLGLLTACIFPLIKSRIISRV